MKREAPPKTQLCPTCAWSTPSMRIPGRVVCMYEPITVEKEEWEFCHHWASTRGWMEPPEE